MSAEHTPELAAVDPAAVVRVALLAVLADAKPSKRNRILAAWATHGHRLCSTLGGNVYPIRGPKRTPVDETPELRARRAAGAAILRAVASVHDDWRGA